MADTEVMVQAALSKLGAVYVWGATGPTTFDCSGLTQWSAKQAGITIGRTTYQQVNDGTPVVGDPQRGDLVFPEAGHVVIALGGDQCVHAPETGDVVKISKYWTKPFAIRRLGANSGTPGSTNTSGAYGTESVFDLNDLTSGTPVQGIQQIYTAVKAFATFTSALSDRHTWVRVLKGLVGIIVIILGMGALGFAFLGSSPKQLATSVKTKVTS